MADKETIHKQNLQDLIRVVAVLAEILEKKELTDEDDKRLDYTTKVVNNVKEKIDSCD